MAAFKGFRAGTQNWFEVSGSSTADIWSAEGQRGGVLAKSVTAAGPQTEQAPVDGPVFALEPGPQLGAFAAGNVVVYRVGVIGSGTALGSTATAVFLDEYNAAGTRVQTIDMPTLDNGLHQILTASGSATSEGLLTLSADGQYLILTGYDATLGTTGVATSSALRVIGRVDSSGNVDTTTTTTAFSGVGIRSAASTDGTTFWAAGSGTGVVSTTLGGSGAGTLVSSTFTNLRGIDIYNGQLYVSSGAGALRLGAVGNGTPTGTGETITSLNGFPTATLSPHQFFFADLTAAVAGVDTLYITDDRATASGGGLVKYSLVSNSWTLNGTAAGGLTTGLRGLAGDQNGTTVSFYATTTQSNANQIFSLTDTGGYNAAFSSSTLVLVATAAANTAFRGIAFAPTPVAGPETQTVVFNPTTVTHNEGNSGTTVYSFIVTRTGGTTGQLDFSGTISAGSTDNADYVGGTAPTVFNGSILAGQANATVTVNIQGDLTIEGSESFTLTLTNVTNAAAGVTEVIGAAATATGNITNDDSAGTISVADVAVLEGDAGTTPGAFTLTRTGGSIGAVSVDYLITLPGGVGGADSSDVSATLSGTVNFADGQTVATIPFTVNGDVTDEGNETFTVALSNALGGVTITDGNAVATITNDDAPPALSIGDATLVEGNGGVTYMVFTISLSKVAAGAVTVDYQTAPGTAIDGSDYLGIAGQVSIPAGQLSRTISVPIVGDTNPENAETLTVTLSNAVGAGISDGSATGTITNDDGAAYYPLASGSFTQNWTNTGQITTDDDWSGVPYIIGYRGDDLTTATGTDARTITTTSSVIDVNADQTAPNTFGTGGVAEFFDATNIPNATIALNGSGTADAPYIVLFMNATGRSDIRLQANLRDIDGSADDAAQQINVQYRTSASGAWINAPGGYFADVTTGGTATQVTALDIILPSGANGAAALEIRIMTTNAVGNDEWVGIDDIIVSSAVSGPSLSIADAAIFEGNSGTTALTFTVTRSGDSTGAVTADYAVNFGSGPFGANAADFAAPLTGQVSFAGGATTATITVNIQGDANAEGDDGFTVTLSNPSAGATIADGTAIGTIVNDDGPPSLVTINDVTVTEGNAGTSLMTFTVSRTGGTGAFDVNWETANGSATAGQDYVAASGTVNFANGQMTDTVTVAITINGDTDAELSETLQVLLSGATNGALITDATGTGTIAGDDPIYIHDIQGTSYYSPILAGEGLSSFNTASAGSVIVRAVVTAVDNDGPRQGYYLSEEVTDWDGNSFTSEGIFVMTRNDAGVGSVVSGVTVGDLVQVTAQVMEYQSFNTMPRTVLVNPTGLQIVSSGNSLPTVTLTNMRNEVMTLATPDYTDSSDGVGDTFDASLYALSYFETVEGMLVTIPNMVVADGFVSTSGGRPFLQAYSLDSANADQINSRGGYTIAGDPPIGPPDTAGTPGDDTHNGGRVLHDGDVNPDIIELDFTGFAMAPPTGLTNNATMGDQLGDVTGIIDFDFTDRKLFVTAMEPGGFVNDGIPTQEVTVLGDDSRSLTVATFNVENLDPGDGAARFTALANVIANNLNAPDIISIEEIQDNNGATASGGADASTTWNMLVTALNLATGAHYQWVDQEPNGSEGGEPGGNIRVGFLYNTDRVQLGNLDANASLAERRLFTDRIGDGVRDAGDLIAFSDNMLGAEITASDWSGTRRSLLGEFTFNGNTVYVTANHFPAKGGSGEFWQLNQTLENGDPDNSGWAQRNAVAQDVYSMLNLVQSTNAGAGIVAGGDFNDFYFYRPLTTVTGYTMADGTARVGGARFDNLTLMLAEAERYTYTFDGRSQAIDHVIANTLLSGVATYDVVHINTGYNASGTGPDADPGLSDHDPGLASFDYRNFSEVLNGTAGNDAINGFGGNDRINGGGGADAMQGGTGDDFFFVDNAGDTTQETAGEGFDIVWTTVSYILAAGTDIEALSTRFWEATGAINLTGNEIANNLYGNAGANALDGGGGSDVLFGFGGNDSLTGGTGTDVMYGGAGDDFYFIDNTGDTAVEAAAEGYDVAWTTASYVLAAGIEIEVLSARFWEDTTAIDLTGNALDNVIVGNAGVNQLNGMGGNDNFDGMGGNDTLLGGAGNDRLQGGTGADAMFGGANDDFYFVDNSGDTAIESASQGFDVVWTSVSYALAAGSEIEALSAISWEATTALILVGNDLGNALYGNAGSNVLNGRGGNDTLVGFGGADSFLFDSALSGNVDTIADFSGPNDTIVLDDSIFAALSTGTLNANAFVIGTAALDADDRIIYDMATGALYYDADGSGGGAAVQFAILQGAPPINSSDFQVI